LLIDTNILVRTLQPHHPLYSIADRAIRQLLRQGREFHIVPQNLIELWAVLTRPMAYNGLGLMTVAALAELERLKNIFLLLPETPAIFPAWEALVGLLMVRGSIAL
jgi:predicted nucleic acid-binding protein